MRNSAERLTAEDMEYLYGETDDEVIIEICNFGTLAAIFAGASAGVSLAQGRRHNRRCNGDCANCPPHYGYRYGRWYYGHDHDHGCEFGGNKGSGSMD